MKNGLINDLILTVLCLGMASQSWAYYIDDASAGTLDGSVVGGLDTFVEEDVKQGKPTEEVTWADNIVSPSLNFAGKTEDVDFFKTEIAGIFAFQLDTSPGFYILKNAKRVALFENKAHYSWGVFNSSELSSSMNLDGNDGWQISHVTEAGSSVSVTEPANLALLGLGLIGLIGIRSKLAF